jgi:hypothetical protein
MVVSVSLCLYRRGEGFVTVMVVVIVDRSTVQFFGQTPRPPFQVGEH